MGRNPVKTQGMNRKTCEFCIGEVVEHRMQGGLTMTETKYVVFKLAKERYGVPIDAVERILPKQSVTRMPRSPKMLMGVFELRGSTIPAMDARLRFGMDESDETRNFVVVLTPQGRCALNVDIVEGIVTLREDQVEPPTVLAGDGKDPFIHGVGKQDDRLLVLLDPQHVVPKELHKRIAAAA